MPRYVATIDTPQSANAAFAYMSDLSNLAAWDPGVTTAQLRDGTEPAVGTTYVVDVRFGPRTMPFVYRIVEFESPRRVLFAAETRWLRSVDEVRVEPSETGARVVYDARLSLRGPLAALDPLMGPAFRRVGDRAAAGLHRALGVGARRVS
ncbi:MAG: hypothetical protein FJW88_11620 [Actinobacteria bacterium]|nr:hypothetical protein [Actinomycetota bacterium]